MPINQMLLQHGIQEKINYTKLPGIGMYHIATTFSWMGIFI